MSNDVKLSVGDFTNVIRWFELAFAKTNNATAKDKQTFTKISAMAMSYTEDLREDNDIKDDS